MLNQVVALLFVSFLFCVVVFETSRKALKGSSREARDLL